jgi:hypothetical protein
LEKAQELKANPDLTKAKDSWEWAKRENELERQRQNRLEEVRRVQTALQEERKEGKIEEKMTFIQALEAKRVSRRGKKMTVKNITDPFDDDDEKRQQQQKKKRS